MFVMLTAALWSLLSGLHLVVEDFGIKVFLTDLKFVFVASLPVLWVLLAASFSGRQISPKIILMLFVVPAVTIALISSNPSHHLVFKEALPLVTDHFTSVARDYGPWFWVHTFYSYSLIITGIGIFIRQIFTSKGHLRLQAVIMLCGSLVPSLFNAIYLSNPDAFYHLDFTPVSFALSGVVYFVGLFRFRMLELLPIAREEIIRSMADGVIVTDPKGFVVEINCAAGALIGKDTNEPVGMAIGTLSPFVSDFWKSAQGLDSSSKEIQFGTDETDPWYAATTKAVLDSTGVHQGYLILFRNITERKQAETQLHIAKNRAEELSQLKSAFLANMSHDVRTPLAGIIGLADVLVEELEGEQEQFAGLIREAGDRLLKLLNSILSVAHLSAGTLDRNTEMTDVCSLSSKILSGFEKECASKNLALAVSYPPHCIFSELDPNHLTHALSHLLDHAIRFTDMGSIQFDLRSEQSDLIFRITDTGCGFATEFVDSINQSLDSITLAEFGLDKGSALGLRVAHGFIEEMGGTLTIVSEINRGTTFSIRLPLRNVAAQESAASGTLSVAAPVDCGSPTHNC